MRMAARAASGMSLARGAAARITTKSVIACTTPATGLAAPLLMLVTVRAMVPVAGMPPKKGTTKLAMPWPISSWLGSWRSSVIASETRAHKRLSMAPKSAIVSIGPISPRKASRLKSGSCRSGNFCGIPPNFVPMVSTGRLKTETTTVESTSTMTVPGRCAIHRFHAGPPMA